MPRSLLLVAAVAMLGGCTASAVNPDAGITITGRALDGAGNPLPHAGVTLARSSLSAINNTCGLAILPDSTRTATTDDSGHYQFALTGADTQAGGNARCFEAASSAGDGGPASFADFPVQVDAVAVPDLQLWDAQLAATPGGGVTQFGWRPAPAALTGDLALDGQTLTLQGPDGPAWLVGVDKATGAASLPDELREDWAVKAQVVAHGAPRGSGVVFNLVARSAGVALAAGVQRPLSRGAPCSSPDTGLASPCPFTDGLLGTAVGGVGQVVVTLSAPAKPSRLVLRSATGGRDVTVESSGDGVSFTSVGSGNTGNGFAELSLSVPLPVRTFRVSFHVPGQTATSPSSLAELSLFP